jgi:hypothetical protein
LQKQLSHAKGENQLRVEAVHASSPEIASNTDAFRKIRAYKYAEDVLIFFTCLKAVITTVSTESALHQQTGGLLIIIPEQRQNSGEL